jgi:pimeloyl-ACP methyl ester carboxylesterase
VRRTGKSLASAAVGLVADRALPALWLTPLLDQPAVVEGLLRSTAPTMLVGGTDDPTWSPDVLAPARSIEIVELSGLDHSLQVPSDVRASLEALGEAVSAVDRFLSATLAEGGVDNR